MLQVQQFTPCCRYSSLHHAAGTAVHTMLPTQRLTPRCLTQRLTPCCQHSSSADLPVSSCPLFSLPSSFLTLSPTEAHHVCTMPQLHMYTHCTDLHAQPVTHASSPSYTCIHTILRVCPLPPIHSLYTQMPSLYTFLHTPAD